MKTPGYDVQEGDVVTVEGRPVEAPEKPVYYALNKPAMFELKIVVRIPDRFQNLI